MIKILNPGTAIRHSLHCELADGTVAAAFCNLEFPFLSHQFSQFNLD